MRLTIHRGAHEIGGTCIELESGDSRILLDFGMPLVGQDREPFYSAQVKN
jgi:ribonuclease J